MNYPHEVGFELYESESGSVEITGIAKAFKIPALVVPESSPAGVSARERPGESLVEFVSFNTEGKFNIYISKDFYYGLQTEFNVEGSRQLVDVVGLSDEYNPFGFILDGFPAQRANFIESISVYDRIVQMKKTVSLPTF